MTDLSLDLPAFLDRSKNGIVPVNHKPKPLVFTYTNLHTYDDVCPHQMFRRYIKKDIPYVETEAMRWGNQVHSAFELRISGGKPLPENMQQWECFAKPFEGRDAKTEMKVAITAKAQPCDYFADNVHLRGKIDIAVINGNTAFIDDLKTGSSKYEDPFELAVHAMMLKCKMPTLTTIKGAYTWLREDRQGETHDLSNFRQTWDKVNEIAGRIEVDQAAGEFAKKQSGLCGWCDVRDCEHNRNKT